MQESPFTITSVGLEAIYNYISRESLLCYHLKISQDSPTPTRPQILRLEDTEFESIKAFFFFFLLRTADSIFLVKRMLINSYRT